MLDPAILGAGTYIQLLNTARVGFSPQFIANSNGDADPLIPKCLVAGSSGPG